MCAHTTYPSVNSKALRRLLRSQGDTLAQRLVMETLGEGQIGVNAQVVWQLMAQNMYRSGDVPLLAVRETLQNSVDAIRAAYRAGQLKPGKGLFRVTVSDDHHTLIIEDNGIGMDLETLQKKFLVLGETGKQELGQSDLAIGGFGVAKAVILAASKTFQWRLETRDLIAESTSTEQPILFYRSKTSLQGTRITLFHVNHEARSEEYGLEREALPRRIARMLASNILPDIRIQLDEQHITSAFSKGGIPYPISEDAWPNGVNGTFTLFKPHKVDARTGLFVLIGGLFQFRRSFVDPIDHTVVLNLELRLHPKSPQYPLSAGRDQLRGKLESTVDAVLRTLISEKDVSNQDSQVLLLRHRLANEKLEEQLRDIHTMLPEWAKKYSRYAPVNQSHRHNRWAHELAKLRKPSDTDPPLFSMEGVFYRSGWLNYRDITSPIADEQYDVTESKTLKGLERYREWLIWAYRKTQWRSRELESVRAWMKAKSRNGLISPRHHADLLTILGDYTQRLSLLHEEEEVVPEEVSGFRFAQQKLFNPMGMVCCVLLASKPDDEKNAATILSQFRHMEKSPSRYLLVLVAWDYALTRIHLMSGSGHQLIWHELDTGLILEEETLGMYLPLKNRAQFQFRGLLLCNPVNFMDYMHQHVDDPFRVAAYLYHVAVHEYVHAMGYTQHDQNFVYERERLGKELITLLFDLAEVLMALFRLDRTGFCSPRVLSQLKQEESERAAASQVLQSELVTLNQSNTALREQLQAMIAQAFRDANVTRGETTADLARAVLHQVWQSLKQTEDPALVDEFFMGHESVLLSHLYVLLCTDLAS
ncbi:MAG: hypothetical protein ACKO6N_21160 [Myxococcota bacterium]